MEIAEFRSLIRKIASEWLCKRREGYSHNSDVWNLRRVWTELKPSLKKRGFAGADALSPLTEIHIPEERMKFGTLRMP